MCEWWKRRELVWCWDIISEPSGSTPGENLREDGDLTVDLVVAKPT